MTASAISYPLALPSVGGLAAFSLRDRAAVDMSESPFTFAQQVFEHQGDGWFASMEYTDLTDEQEAAWTAWRLSLAGHVGTFLMGPKPARTPQGTWSSLSPLVSGAHLAGARAIDVRGQTSMTWKAGDFFQLGSGSSSRLHRVTQDGGISGSPQVGVLEFWPRLRADLADAAVITLADPKGLWRLAAKQGGWSVHVDSGYLLPTLEAVEALP